MVVNVYDISNGFYRAEAFKDIEAARGIAQLNKVGYNFTLIRKTNSAEWIEVDILK